MNGEWKVVYLYKGILLKMNKQQISDASYILDKLGKCTKWKKADSKDQFI